MVKSLVTGAAGFIGSHLCERLLQQQHQVVGIDNLSNSTRDYLPIESDRFTFKQIDCLDLKLLNDMFEWFKPELVFHQAALGSIPRSLANPYIVLQNNVFGFHNILQMCRTHKVRRLIYASSSSVYGGNPNYIKYEANVGDALNPYALSKQMNESQAKTWARAYGVESIGLRYFNVFGPNQNRNSEYAAVVAKWLGCIEQGDELVVHGSGAQMRDFTYVDNVTYANVLASMVMNDSVNNVYNVGAGRSVSLNQMLEEIVRYARNLGYKIPALRRESARPGDVQATLADLKKSKKWLGYEPQISWDEGVKKTCDAILRRQKWLE